MEELLKIIELSNQICELANKFLSGNKIPIAELGLSGRASNCLHRASIEYIEQLIKLTEEDLLKIRNMGIKTKNEITQKVKSFDYIKCTHTC